MHIEVTVFDASMHVVRIATVDTESPQSLLSQLEEISPFECWEKLQYFEWRNGVPIHQSFIYRHEMCSKRSIAQQCDYLKRNWKIDMKNKGVDRITLEISLLKTDACRTKTSIISHASRNPYILK